MLCIHNLLQSAFCKSYAKLFKVTTLKMSNLGAIHLTKHTGPKHTATVIFFHGSGATGDHMKDWVSLMSKNFSFPHIKIAYPTAPLQPYTPACGTKSHVWFDRAHINPNAPEKLQSLKSIQIEIQDLIKHEVASGIPTNRIVVGGFSMGGALAMYTGYKWERNVAGVFAFSSFLNVNSCVYQDLKESPHLKLPPLLQLHGNCDDLVTLLWGQSTFNELTECGVKGEFHILERLGHSINKRGINIIRDWVEKILPES